MNPADNQNTNQTPVGDTQSAFPPQTEDVPSPFSTPPFPQTDVQQPAQESSSTVNTIPASQAPTNTLESNPQAGVISNSQAEQTQPEVVTTTSSGNGGNGNKKKILAALGVVLMLFGIGAGVYAFRSYQTGPASAWDCSLYVSSLQPNGDLVVTNGSNRDEPAAVARISINGAEVGTVNVPALSAGEGTTLQTNVSLPTNESYTWRVQIAECVNSGSNEVNTVTAECSDVVAYNEDWEVLTDTELSQMTEGDIVRFAVSGTATTGGFDRARFAINSATPEETTDKRPGSDEFYIEYIIPADEDTFSVSAEIHHTDLGWF